MNQVKTYIAPSKIEGVGLFAGQDIKKGTLIWKFSGLDQQFTYKQIQQLKLTELEKQYFKRYEFGKDGVYIFCSDDARFCNHADNPNTDGYPKQYALVDIKKGEEITCNYHSINNGFDKTEFAILKSHNQPI